MRRHVFKLTAAEHSLYISDINLTDMVVKYTVFDNQTNKKLFVDKVTKLVLDNTSYLFDSYFIHVNMAKKIQGTLSSA